MRIDIAFSTWCFSFGRPYLQSKEQKQSLLDTIASLDKKEFGEGLSVEDLVLGGGGVLPNPTRISVILIGKEVYWRQRSRVKLLSKGDISTRFIHKISSSKRRIIRIQAVQFF